MSAIIDTEIDYESLGGNYPLHINMIAGSLAGITEHAVMFPVDLVRVRNFILTSTDSYASSHDFADGYLYRNDRGSCAD